MTEAAAEAYRRRFRRVLEHIDQHLEGDISVDGLGIVAGFSKFHFHRQFSELLGIGVYKYVQLVRLKRAAYQLAFRNQERIIDIALGSGYESHEAFSRAFKKIVGQTPSEFRERPRWGPWHAIFQPLNEVRSEHMKPDHRAENVNIVDFKPTRVGVLEHRGDPARLEESIRTFIEWRKQNHLHPRVSATFNLFYGDPARRRRRSFGWTCARPPNVRSATIRSAWSSGPSPAGAARSCATSDPTTPWATRSSTSTAPGCRPAGRSPGTFRCTRSG